MLWLCLGYFNEILSTEVSTVKCFVHLFWTCFTLSSRRKCKTCWRHREHTKKAESKTCYTQYSCEQNWLSFPRKAQPHALFIFIPADLPTGNCPGLEIKAPQLAQKAASSSPGLFPPKRWSLLSRISSTIPCDKRGKTFQAFQTFPGNPCTFVFKNNSGSSVLLLSLETTTVSDWSFPPPPYPNVPTTHSDLNTHYLICHKTHQVSLALPQKYPLSLEIQLIFSGMCREGAFFFPQTQKIQFVTSMYLFFLQLFQNREIILNFTQHWNNSSQKILNA